MVYSHPPITEAVLDLRVDELDVDASVLLQVVKAFPEFQEIKDLQHVTDELELVVEDKTATAHASSKFIGFVASTSGRTRLLQIRRNGFALSHLAPYQSWEALEVDAQRYWRRYRDALSPSVVRMATRYINRFDLPSAGRLDFADYFETIPRIPKALDTGLAGFFMQLVLPQPDLGATAIINQAMAQPPNSETSSLILDIDLFIENGIPDDEETLWDKFRELRTRKNKIFEDCLKDTAREVIK